jgi:alpha-mannosidase
MDHVEIINWVDKARLQAASYHAKEGKESVNFAFPFRVPGGELLLDLPFAMIRPESGQMASACKNWFTIGRWAEVANNDYGVTWVTLDAPLVQIGGITATLLNSQTDPDVWRKEVEPSQRIYSWAMNNHWGTNYRAYQDSPTRFRFVLRLHRRLDPAEASRFAIGFGQPLIAVPARETDDAPEPLVRVQPDDILVTGFKPADDGRGFVVRLFNTSDESRQASLRWKGEPTALFMSDTSEKARRKVTGSVPVLGRGLVTLRVETE